MDPDDIGKAAVSALDKPSMRSFIGRRTQVSYMILSQIRDWKKHNEKLGLTLSGGLRDSATGHHAHIFMRRHGE